MPSTKPFQFQVIIPLWPLLQTPPHSQCHMWHWLLTPAKKWTRMTCPAQGARESLTFPEFPAHSTNPLHQALMIFQSAHGLTQSKLESWVTSLECRDVLETTWISLYVVNQVILLMHLNVKEYKDMRKVGQPTSSFYISPLQSFIK